MRFFLFLSLLFLGPIFFYAETANAAEDEFANRFKEMGFVILKSTTSYKEAKQFAERASQKLTMPLDLRGLSPNTKMGLTFSKQTCDEHFGYPCYIARGRYDKKEAYLSIEHSSAYESFSKGYYIVIAASGDKSDPSLKKVLKKVKAVVADAYIKNDKVFMGCLH